MSYSNRKFNLLLIIIPGDGPSLLGQKWLEVIELNWKKVHQLRATNASNPHGVLARYPDIFNDRLGTLRDYSTKLNIDKDAKPIFCKA